MTTLKNIQIPDIGGATDVAVIDILVRLGDRINAGDGLVTLESDKATMEVPSSHSGIVKEIKVSPNDKVREGTVVVVLEMDDAPITVSAVDVHPQVSSVEHVVVVPDIGTTGTVPVIDVLVNVGDQVEVDTPLITLESDKATMDVPSPVAGLVTAIKLAVGNLVAQGTEILVLQTAAVPVPVILTESRPASTSPPPPPVTAPSLSAPVSSPAPSIGTDVYAGPAVRRLAREFGVDLRRVNGSGRHRRVTVADVQQYVKGELAKTQSVTAGTMSAVEAPVVDFAKFGATEKIALTRIQKLSSKGLHRNWLLVPHVTQFGEADITHLEALRTAQKSAAQSRDVKLTPLVYIMKAVVRALQEFPRFNSSLAPDGEHIILKKYFHIGVAVDTPDGLVVPVVRDVDQKDIFVLASELAQVSAAARAGQLKAHDMQGGCFSISSLGGIGGTSFTPIINVPEVAILGVSRSFMKPVYDGKNFIPQLTLPLSLSYDHRVIDGALGARFIAFLSECLATIEQYL